MRVGKEGDYDYCVFGEETDRIDLNNFGSRQKQWPVCQQVSRYLDSIFEIDTWKKMEGGQVHICRSGVRRRVRWYLNFTRY